MNPFGFGRGRSTRSLGAIPENQTGSKWLEDAKSKSGAGSLFVYKGFRTLSYSPSLRAMGALSLPDDEQPVPRPHISKHLDRFSRNMNMGMHGTGQATGADGATAGGDAGGGGGGVNGANPVENELISPMRHATLSLSGLEFVRARQGSGGVDTNDFPDAEDQDDEDADGNEDEGYEVVG